MSIKVVVNYPETEEGMKLLKERQAEAVLVTLNKILTPMQLDRLMQMLEEDNKKS